MTATMNATLRFQAMKRPRYTLPADVQDFYLAFPPAMHCEGGVLKFETTSRPQSRAKLTRIISVRPRRQ